VCQAERRHSKSADKRGAVGIRVEGTGWRCFQCEATGDVIDFVAYALEGKRFGELRGEAPGRVEAWCRKYLALPRVEAKGPAAGDAAGPRPPPPLREVVGFWNVCTSVDRVPEIAAWLESKRIDPATIADLDLARAIPMGAPLPAWAARANITWLQGGYRLVVQLVDGFGAVRSVRARHIYGGNPKSLAPTDHGTAGLVMACGLARQMLGTGKRPEWWGEAPLRIEIAEGEKKWLMRAALAAQRGEHAPACIGTESGAWKQAHADRIPDGAEVFVATDADKQGAIYATDVVRTLAARIRAGLVQVELRDEHVLSGTAESLRVEVRAT
jgi:hypothetical protein